MAKQILLVSHRSGSQYFVKDLGSDYHCTEGVVNSSDLLSEDSIVTSSKKVRFSKINPTLCDLKPEFSRGPQIVTEKDVGYIIARTGINKESKCVDAGAGTGAMALTLANIANQVTCYDVNKKHLNVVKKNIELTGIKNLVVKEGDVAKELSETNLDLITLDLPCPELALAKVDGALKLGGWLVVYLPNILQMKTVLSGLEEHKSLKLVELTELSKRDWKVEKEILRPVHTQVVHTGFLAFVRKL